MLCGSFCLHTFLEYIMSSFYREEAEVLGKTHITLICKVLYYNSDSINIHMYMYKHT